MVPSPHLSARLVHRWIEERRAEAIARRRAARAARQAAHPRRARSEDDR